VGPEDVALRPDIAGDSALDDRAERRTSLPLRMLLLASGVAITCAGVALTVAAAQTRTFFAWDIQPPVTAAFIGALYLSGIPGLFLVARSGTLWRQTRLVMAPYFVLSVAMLVATALHTERFIWSHVATWVWIVLYALFAVATPVLSIVHARTSAADPPPIVPLGRGLRVFFAFGVLLAVPGLIGLIAPQTIASYWPWTLTPLTGRVVAGWLLFLATICAGLARERDWTSIRLFFPGSILAAIVLGVGIIRYWDAFTRSPIATWVYVFAVATTLVCSIAVQVVHEMRYERLRSRKQV
jgi:hypothetical protein